MAGENNLDTITAEISKGMSLSKCRKCGCMKEALTTLQDHLPATSDDEETVILKKKVELWIAQMEPEEYSCLGCNHCYPAAAMNAFYELYPESSIDKTTGCGFEIKVNEWPPVAGEYFVLGVDRSRTVAVTTLASTELAKNLAELNPEKLCIVGKLETENIGIDKIIKNTVANPFIRYLIIAGGESEGHLSGETLISLIDNGVDGTMRVNGSPAKRPILKNVTSDEVDAFRAQVQVINMIGCENTGEIIGRITELPAELSTCGCADCERKNVPGKPSMTTVIKADGNLKPQLDKAGYFVIIPQEQKKLILVEHYANDNTLQRIIEGNDARSIYLTIVKNGLISEMTHAAYLGKELEKAELSMKMGFKYVQDGA